MSSEASLRVSGLSKCYEIYQNPRDRLKQAILPKFDFWLARMLPARRVGGRRPYFREFWAVRDISFAIGKGETVGIIGRNGSGKSTLLQIICGTVTPTVGEVQVNGRIAALLELGAGFNPEFTGRENAFLNAAILGLTPVEIADRFPEIERFAELGDFIDQPVKTYSSGMYVRLAFSVAINVNPQILVIDEALAVGDIRFQAKCLNAIKKMQGQGTTILFVSHDISAVRTLCDRAIWLERGQIRMTGNVFTVTSEFVRHLFDDSEAETAESSTVPETALEKPLNHWGSHCGSILDATIYDAAGQRRDCFTEQEPMCIEVRFRMPGGVDPATLSVAFSIKNLAGTDLIVSTTWDQKKCDLSLVQGEGKVLFRLLNQLNAGKYLLAVALENRMDASVQYYEYIEGICYLSSLQDYRYFGLFLPEIEQELVTDGKREYEYAGNQF